MITACGRGVAFLTQSPRDYFAGKKKLLAIGDVRAGSQHDSVSHALTFGHLPETRDNRAIQKMYFEAIRWAMKTEEHP